MFVVQGEDPHGFSELMDGEFSSVAEALLHINGSIGFIERSLQLSGMDTEIVSGVNWKGVRDKATGNVWRYIAIEVQEPARV